MAVDSTANWTLLRYDPAHYQAPPLAPPADAEVSQDGLWCDVYAVVEVPTRWGQQTVQKSVATWEREPLTISNDERLLDRLASIGPFRRLSRDELRELVAVVREIAA